MFLLFLPICAPICQHIFHEGGGVEAVGAAGGALAAFDAGLDALHLCRPFRGIILLPGAAAKEHIHSGAVADLDACRTGHTIAAASAEGTHQRLPVCLHHRLQFLRQSWVFLCQIEPLPQFFQGLDAPDGHHIVILLHEGMAGRGILQKAAGQTLHGDEAHVRFLAFACQRDVLRGRDIAEGELEGLKIPGGNGLPGHGVAVGGDADVADPAPLFCLQSPGIVALRVIDIGQRGDLMKLEKVDMVGSYGTSTS